MDDEDAEYMQGSDDEVRVCYLIALTYILHLRAGLRV
jgi:hypothetical protein